MGIQDFYKQTASILTPSISAGAITGDATYTTASTVIGLLRPTRGSSSFTADKRDIIFSHKFYCANSATITEDDRLLIDSITYAVNYIVDPNSMGHHKEIYIDRLNGV